MAGFKFPVHDPRLGARSSIVNFYMERDCVILWAATPARARTSSFEGTRILQNIPEFSDISIAILKMSF